MKRPRSSSRASAAQFPSTCWSRIQAAADPRGAGQRDSLETLLRAYWKPVYAYVRASWRKTPEDAQDLTQAFFAHFLEKGYLSRLDPDKGRFRGYLKRSLQHFLIDAERRAAVRRPANPTFRLDASEAELGRLAPASPEDTPDRAYDREWFRCVLEAAVAESRTALMRAGKSEYFEVFRLVCLDPPLPEEESRGWLRSRGRLSDRPRYKEAGARLGLAEADVRYRLSYCRALLRRALRRHVRGTVASDEDVAQELSDLLS